jgi:hypothetical protein
MKIGHVHAGAVMVADDLALAAESPHELQIALTTAEADASRERYKFNRDKTKTVVINTKHVPELTLSGGSIGASESEAHLGIYRSHTGNNRHTVEERIKGARRAAYALMGAGLHGLNGTGPEVSLIQYSTYVIPTLLYGLEALVLGKTEMKSLEDYHRKNLRHIQHLPRSTAIPAIYLLTGSAPIEAQIHIKTLTLFRNIVAPDMKSPSAVFLRELILRQLAMKELESASWTSHVRKLLNRYDLPTAYSIITNAPLKRHWKHTVKQAVFMEWSNQLREDATERTTLKFINLPSCLIGQMHPVWQHLYTPLGIRMATVKAQLMVQRYALTTSPTAGARKSETCPLCKSGPETTEHFLLTCSVLSKQRYPYLLRVLQTCRDLDISVDPHTLTSIILDTNALNTFNTHSQNKNNPNQTHEELCRNFIFKLHCTRAKLLGGVSGYKLVR